MPAPAGPAPSPPEPLFGDPAFPPGRAAGLARLAHFVPRSGAAYAAGRNTDPGPDQPGAVSRLSPWLRYRLIDEQEVIAAVLARHRLPDCDKFVQEVLWRTYWKGWLERRPAVWSRFIEERDRQRDNPPDPLLLADAEAGRTGIEGFDDWARELVGTGYLHNHARMWFASIWIFTLRLPWALGADFFLRHLIDADAASNILSWRWVAGLQTAGKTYLATADNIARHTGGRFAPRGLASEAVALVEPPIGAAGPVPPAAPAPPPDPALLLVTADDLHPEALWTPGHPVAGVLVVDDPALLWGDRARGFVNAAMTDTAARLGAHFAATPSLRTGLDASGLVAVAEAAGVRHIVTPYAPVGPVADALAAIEPTLAAAGVALHRVRREWDEWFWPHATKGFFPFKERIPAVLRELGLT
ncbi:FAD-binding domain-containing protein [Novosphingobium aerophilum]|uniref:DNA photolyase FAD-binding protein n=1 Tax=Novosphingobium aerophilum TaxID=2839843 RepID=A0A7X1F4X8_9SPHN|nr:FAD-binding domain-containing protein [Novosphingobium aerophilum]MBC2650319.1 DNA photolyase FAD-binding protein [Novosphingobium aerophilum]